MYNLQHCFCYLLLASGTGIGDLGSVQISCSSTSFLVLIASQSTILARSPRTSDRRNWTIKTALQGGRVGKRRREEKWERRHGEEATARGWFAML